ncbi:hypothetical protein Bpfe_009666 [Biomphalaria pfeifferi]|uniref:Uncharacterized protein n=1 Tax=Biomphalaria pfeifferi TaxID=112525 RepID=A0AAD8FDD0_BIOPF|nr:hypothetical protein Bpfe_009666 [Biomphalaria pfeifferi]
MATALWKVLRVPSWQLRCERSSGSSHDSCAVEGPQGPLMTVVLWKVLRVLSWQLRCGRSSGSSHDSCAVDMFTQ